MGHLKSDIGALNGWRRDAWSGGRPAGLIGGCVRFKLGAFDEKGKKRVSDKRKKKKKKRKA